MQFLIGFRKFTYGMIFFSVTLILLLFELINGTDFIKYNSDVAVAFMATNIGEHIINITKQYLQDKLLNKVLDKTNEDK